ncbi:MAG: flagellar hook-length control protein FliK, partial [Chitinispirillaceae bacterium]|nr:flagellar hook-length control protein FliK [Chitinispirillaceae bacterium]
MRPDAMASSHFTKTMQQGRMDRSHGGHRPGQAQGFGSQDTDAHKNVATFENVYGAVARSNGQACAVTEASTNQTKAQEAAVKQLLLSAAGNTEEQTAALEALSGDLLASSLASEDLLKLLNLMGKMQDGSLPSGLAISADGFMQLTGIDQYSTAGQQQLFSEASALISQALTEISQALNLTVDPALQSLSISNNANDLAVQFSEILYALKQIAGVLDDAVAKNQTIALNQNATIDVPQARALASFIQVRTFRIEIGVSMLGIADKVQAELSQKLAQPFSGNIGQALNPMNVSMPSAHIEQVFGKFFQDSSQTMAMLVQKIREICVKYGQGNGAQVSLKVMAQTTTVMESVRSPATASQFPFDTQVMRKLLKIEGKELLAQQNSEAANQAIKLDLPFAGLKPVFMGGLDAGVKLAEELLPLTDLSGKITTGQILAGFEAKSVLPSFRAPDETIMSQITEKLHAAIRNGMHEIRLHLRPETLGDVQLRIRVEGDVVFARINVESHQVRQIVETNMQLLRDSLQQQNLNCGSIEVTVGNDGWEDDGREVRNGLERDVADASGAVDGNAEEGEPG